MFALLAALFAASPASGPAAPSAAPGATSTAQKPSALAPVYRWEAVATCDAGAVLARLPIHPGRLAVVQDLGCALDYLDIDGRRARVLPVLTPRLRRQKVAFFAVPLEWEAGTAAIGACGAAGCLGLWLPIEDVPYPKSEIKVDKKFMAPSAADAKRIKRDQIHIAGAFGVGMFDGHVEDALCSVQQFEWPWRLPRPPVYTSVFGGRRVYNGQTKSRHLGTDFDGEMGEPIIAAQAGTVVLAEDLFFSGNSVFLTHGLGLFTTYFHMTKIEVVPGQRVRPGDLLGTIGRTGRVTGPHLHFASKLWGHYFEPTELFNLDLELSDLE